MAKVPEFGNGFYFLLGIGASMGLGLSLVAPLGAEPLPDQSPAAQLAQLSGQTSATEAPVELPEGIQNLPGVIQVQEFRYQGSTVYSPETLDATVQFEEIYRGQEVTLAEVLQAATQITQRYVEDGYITSGAFLPLEANTPEQLEAGIVTIEILEGRVEPIQITGLQRLRSGYVRSRLARGAQQPLNQEQLLQSLQLLRLDPLIESLSAELSVGAEPGTSVLQVAVVEAPSFGLQLSTDNNRSPSVGSFRRGLTIEEGNLLGWGDRIQFSYFNTDGSDEFSGSYSIPLNAKDGTLNLTYRNTDNQVIEEPFESIDIDSPSEEITVSFRQPLILTPAEEFALELSYTYEENETTLLGIPAPLSPGADEDGITRASVLRFAQDYQRQGSQSVLAARSQFSLGVEVFDPTVSDVGAPDNNFFSWRGQFQYVQLTAPDTLLIVRSDLQLADQALFSLEQFGVGGQQTVRGYRENALVTDNGLTGSVEYRFPIYRSEGLPEDRTVVQLTPFLDVGSGWNNSGPNPDPNTLVGLGLGVLWRQGDRFSARVDYGIPLVDIPDSSDQTWQENGIYFSVQYNLF